MSTDRPLNIGFVPETNFRPDVLVIALPCHDVFPSYAGAPVPADDPCSDMPQPHARGTDLRELHRDHIRTVLAKDYYGDFDKMENAFPGISYVERIVQYYRGPHDAELLRRHGIGRSSLLGPSTIPKVGFMYANDGDVASPTMSESRLSELCTAVTLMTNRALQSHTGKRGLVIITSDLIGDRTISDQILQCSSLPSSVANRILWDGESSTVLSSGHIEPHDSDYLLDIVVVPAGVI